MEKRKPYRRMKDPADFKPNPWSAFQKSIRILKQFPEDEKRFNERIQLAIKTRKLWLSFCKEKKYAYGIIDSFFTGNYYAMERREFYDYYKKNTTQNGKN